ncbi:MAG TPA: hypothetical protein VEA99_04890 [Gemmatimonadaceae bacterium]|nr:hypothetical protein [Gemmatimonadaceae bacterium]
MALAFVALTVVVGCESQGAIATGVAQDGHPMRDQIVACYDTPTVCKRITAAIYGLMVHPDGSCQDLGWRAHQRYSANGFRVASTRPDAAPNADMWTYMQYGVTDGLTYNHTSVFSDATWDLNRQNGVTALIAHEELHHLGNDHPPGGDIFNSYQRCFGQQ